MQHFNTSRQYAPCNQKAGSRRSLNRVLGPVEDRRRRPHKRTALAKLRDALWGGPFLCPNFCIAWMQKRLLNLALKVSITVLLIEYSSTESATFSPPSQWMMGAIFITNKPKKYVFIQLPFHLAKGNGIRLGPRRNAWPNLASPSTQIDPYPANNPSNPNAWDFSFAIYNLPYRLMTNCKRYSGCLLFLMRVCGSFPAQP